MWAKEDVLYNVGHGECASHCELRMMCSTILTKEEVLQNEDQGVLLHNEGQEGCVP